MITAPPNSTEVDSRVDAIRSTVSARIRRRSRLGQVGIGTVLAGAFTLTGAGIATASFPVTIDMQGVVKTPYVNEFVQSAHWRRETRRTDG